MKTLSKFLTIGLIISLFSACRTNTRINSATHDEGVVINGVRWATRNVDAPGTFAENSEDMGMLYQWNRDIGWSTTDPMTNSIWDSSMVEGTEWYAENDPCPQGWRVPTTRELHLLGRGQRVNVNGVYGHLFGTASNQIFLPIAGWRCINSGALVGVGRSGIYWSSMFDDTFSAWVFPYEGNISCFGGRDRPIGYSIRCVAK